MNSQDPRLAALERLLGIIDHLRAPDGCPWDREQTLASMAPHVLEEAYEVVDALRGADDLPVIGEIGDLLMNLFLLARIAQDEARFSLAEVCARVCDKLVRRHPHVFGEDRARDGQDALQRWESIKREERRAEGGPAEPSTLAGVPADLPALLRAFRIGVKAAQAGFDWPDQRGPLAKITEELEELRAEVEAEPRDPARVEHELGDLLFSVVNLSRHVGVNPEIALRGTIDRFSRRFRHIEEKLGPRLREAGLDELEALWNEAK